MIGATRLLCGSALPLTGALLAFTTPAAPSRLAEASTGQSAAGDSLACLALEPDTVLLVGRLERQTYPGPPTYESVQSGDKPETGFYLHVSPLKCVRLSRNTDKVLHVGEVQLVLDSLGYARLRPRLGQRISLSGTIFVGVNGHQHTPVLLQVAWRDTSPARPSTAEGEQFVALAACDTVSKAPVGPFARLPAVTRHTASAGTFVGSVDERLTGGAVSGGVVRVRGYNNRDVLTDSTGGFIIGNLRPGRYAVLVVHLGYDGYRDTIDVAAGDIVTKRYHLQYRACP